MISFMAETAAILTRFKTTLQKMLKGMKLSFKSGTVKKYIERNQYAMADVDWSDSDRVWNIN